MIQKGTVPFCTIFDRFSLLGSGFLLQKGCWVRVAFRFTEPGHQYSGASVEGREWSALEDPVKNAACLRNVRPRRGR